MATSFNCTLCKHDKSSDKSSDKSNDLFLEKTIHDELVDVFSYFVDNNQQNYHYRHMLQRVLEDIQAFTCSIKHPCRLVLCNRTYTTDLECTKQMVKNLNDYHMYASVITCACAVAKYNIHHAISMLVVPTENSNNKRDNNKYPTAATPVKKTRFAKTFDTSKVNKIPDVSGINKTFDTSKVNKIPVVSGINEPAEVKMPDPSILQTPQVKFKPVVFPPHMMKQMFPKFPFVVDQISPQSGSASHVSLRSGREIKPRKLFQQME